jgi:hypothetical protein
MGSQSVQMSMQYFSILLQLEFNSSNLKKMWFVTYERTGHS